MQSLKDRLKTVCEDTTSAAVNRNKEWVKQIRASEKKWEDFDTLKLPDGTIIDMAKCIDDIARAKSACVHVLPGFGEFVGRMHDVWTFHVDTMATDGYHLFLNPLFTSNLDFESKVAILSHEIMHGLLNHLRRGQDLGHDSKKSNIAADYEVNDTLTDLGIFNKDIWTRNNGLYDAKYVDWGYEKIYAANPPAPQPPKKKKPNKPGGDPPQPPQPPKSKDYCDGWNKVIDIYTKYGKQGLEDIKSGKIKI